MTELGAAAPAALAPNVRAHVDGVERLAQRLQLSQVACWDYWRAAVPRADM